MSDAYEQHEDRVRVRPRRGKSRPRTKERPAHDDAVPARVLAVDRGRCTCATDAASGPSAEPVVVAMMARELGRQAVVVGDRVWLVGDVSGADGTLARVVRVEPRRSALRRTADDDDPTERVIVANADQLAIVTALADPPPQPRLVDRCLVAAYDAGLDPMLCLTKADLADPGPLVEAYAELDVAIVVTGRGRDLTPLRDRLTGRTSVLVGSSGVGKSTLVNALVPGATRATAAVNAVTGRGRHTSASAVALRLPGGGWVIDTPGVRSFGLGHVQPSSLIAAFPDLAAAARDCPRRCRHTAEAPDCALDAAAATGRVDPARLASFRRLLGALDPRPGD